MKTPGSENNGVYWETSFMYVQATPSPRVGSNVEVRQTDYCLEHSTCRNIALTFYVLEREDA